jgi:hypothetical protein
LSLLNFVRVLNVFFRVGYNINAAGEGGAEEKLAHFNGIR